MIISDNQRFVAQTFLGLETVLAKELLSIGAREVTIHNRSVSFAGDKGFLYKSNFALRSCLRILIPITEFNANNEQDYYKSLYNVAWENYLNVSQTFAFQLSTLSPSLNNSHYLKQLAKDALVDRFRKLKNSRPDVSISSPDIEFFIHITAANRCFVSLNASGDPLFKRGYRLQAGTAPLNEVLAAGLLLHAGWKGKEHFFDPFCGSGTIAIEAALIAANIPPQWLRKDFAFKRWKNFEPELWDKIVSSQMGKIRDVERTITAFDIDSRAVEITRQNIAFAGLEDFIHVEQKDFFNTKKEHPPLVIVTNPPYNERMEIDDESFYKKIGSRLKHHYPNTFFWMITSSEIGLKNIGLRPSKKIKVMNGKLPCSFVCYEMFEGKKRKSS